MALRATLRPVSIASYGSFIAEAAPLSVIHPAPPEVESIRRLRDDFPGEGEDNWGGVSDGYCFSISFAAGRLESSYKMVTDFLIEQGYADVPVPADLSELKAFRMPPKLRHQLSLFGEDGYVHNPVKIVFPPKGSKRATLLLRLYNERAAGHLLRFHDRSKREIIP